MKRRKTGRNRKKGQPEFHAWEMRYHRARRKLRGLKPWESGASLRPFDYQDRNDIVLYVDYQLSLPDKRKGVRDRAKLLYWKQRAIDEIENRKLSREVKRNMAKNAKEAPKQEFKEELNDPMIEEVVADENAAENVVEEENTEIKEPELSKEEKEKVATQMAKSYGEVVRRLRRGDRVSGFTLIPTNKAHKNHTVEPLVDLDDNQTLCGIKPEYL